MGREIRNFKQSRRAGGADANAKSYARINRTGSWGKIFSAIKFKKGEIK